MVDTINAWSRLQPIAARVLTKAHRHAPLRLRTAESCTGGLLSGCITEIPGVSEWFEGGVIAYHNDVKIHQLGVDPQLIHTHGAVSAPVAEAMARAVASWRYGGVDSQPSQPTTYVGISITGIAGPLGGTSTKPVGTVYIGLACSQDGAFSEPNSQPSCNVFHRVMHGEGTRTSIRLKAVEAALEMLEGFLDQR